MLLYSSFCCAFDLSETVRDIPTQVVTLKEKENKGKFCTLLPSMATSVLFRQHVYCTLTIENQKAALEVHMPCCKQTHCSEVSHSLAPNVINIYSFSWGGGVHDPLHASIMAAQDIMIYNGRHL